MPDRYKDKARYSVSTAQLAADAVEKARTTNQSWADRRRAMRKVATGTVDSWKRETMQLPRNEAREFARAFFRKYPKAAYWSEVESWRVLDDDVIEFTMRRLPSAD